MPSDGAASCRKPGTNVIADAAGWLVIGRDDLIKLEKIGVWSGCGSVRTMGVCMLLGDDALSL
jgi:hypothetical protein